MDPKSRQTVLSTLDKVQEYTVFNDLSALEFMKYPANVYLFKFNNRNTRKRCEIRSKLTIKTPERRQNMFKANKKNTRTTSLTSFWCFYC